MSDPLIDPTDLGTVLNDPRINVQRALAVIADAQALCETIVMPLPPIAAVVVKRVAARAYMAAPARNASAAAAGSQFGAPLSETPGVWLSMTDVTDLRRSAGGGGAFSIDLLPVGYVAPRSWLGPSSTGADWDQIS